MGESGRKPEHAIQDTKPLVAEPPVADIARRETPSGPDISQVDGLTRLQAAVEDSQRIEEMLRSSGRLRLGASDDEIERAIAEEKQRRDEEQNN